MEARPYLSANGALLKTIYNYTQTDTNLKYGQSLETTRTRVWVYWKSNNI